MYYSHARCHHTHHPHSLTSSFLRGMLLSHRTSQEVLSSAVRVRRHRVRRERWVRDRAASLTAISQVNTSALSDNFSCSVSSLQSCVVATNVYTLMKLYYMYMYMQQQRCVFFQERCIGIGCCMVTIRNTRTNLFSWKPSWLTPLHRRHRRHLPSEPWMSVGAAMLIESSAHVPLEICHTVMHLRRTWCRRFV